VAFHNRVVLSIAGLVLFSSLAVTGSFAKPPAKPKPKPPVVKADPAAGKKVYKINGCAGCHAIKGEGGMSGPDLSSYATDKMKDAKWTAIQIQDPKKHKPDSAMPGYSDKIKGKDLTNLSAYLLTLKG